MSLVMWRRRQKLSSASVWLHWHSFAFSAPPLRSSLFMELFLSESHCRKRRDQNPASNQCLLLKVCVLMTNSCCVIQSLMMCGILTGMCCVCSCLDGSVVEAALKIRLTVQDSECPGHMIQVYVDLSRGPYTPGLLQGATVILHHFQRKVSKWAPSSSSSSSLFMMC